MSQGTLNMYSQIGLQDITNVHVIYQTLGRVFHQDIQTPRSVLKNDAIGRVF